MESRSETPALGLTPSSTAYGPGKPLEAQAGIFQSNMTTPIFSTETLTVASGTHDEKRAGALILNADDWGINRETTDRILECIRAGAVSSTSAMMFMEDSERAASLAREAAVDAGLHLNLTTPFSAANCSIELRERQMRIVKYLRRHPMARVFFNPWLRQTFHYVVSAQIEEFRRLYGGPPAHLDGHHHMHLCANVLSGQLLPAGTAVRRNFTFEANEKSFMNRLYRGYVDRKLAKRHCVTDFFFQLTPLEPKERLRRMFSLAGHAAVEVETHPANPDEYQFLTGGEIFRYAADVPIARGYRLPVSECGKEGRR